MNADTYKIDAANGVVNGCIDLCESPDDDGWYAQEYDFTRKDNATRTSSKIYRDRTSLVKALNAGSHKWGKWS
jgi:hypothetical protein